MDPAAAAAGEEEGGEKPPVIYTMENKPIVTCECCRAGRAKGRRGQRLGGAAAAWRRGHPAALCAENGTGERVGVRPATPRRGPAFFGCVMGWW